MLLCGVFEKFWFYRLPFNPLPGTTLRPRSAKNWYVKNTDRSRLKKSKKRKALVDFAINTARSAVPRAFQNRAVFKNRPDGSQVMADCCGRLVTMTSFHGQRRQSTSKNDTLYNPDSKRKDVDDVRPSKYYQTVRSTIILSIATCCWCCACLYCVRTKFS